MATHKHFVAKKKDLEQSKRVLVQTDTRSVAVVYHAGSFYAFDNICPHADAPLIQGTIVDPCYIECDWHGACFDMKTGKVIESSVEDFSTEEEFDVIWMSHVLEHLIEPDKFLKNIKMNLKKDGVFFIEVPNCEYKPMLENSIKKNPHLFHFTKKSLSKLVENLGYKILTCDVFRPATKSEGMKQKILKNSFPYYPRIMTDVHSGRDLRIILRNS